MHGPDGVPRMGDSQEDDQYIVLLQDGSRVYGPSGVPLQDDGKADDQDGIPWQDEGQEAAADPAALETAVAAYPAALEARCKHLVAGPLPMGSGQAQPEEVT